MKQDLLAESKRRWISRARRCWFNWEGMRSFDFNPVAFGRKQEGNIHCGINTNEAKPLLNRQSISPLKLGEGVIIVNRSP